MTVPCPDRTPYSAWTSGFAATILRLAKPALRSCETTKAFANQGSKSVCIRSYRGSFELLPTRLVVTQDGPHLSPELVPALPGERLGHARWPCHLRAIPSTMRPVYHGQPRTLTVL